MFWLRRLYVVHVYIFHLCCTTSKIASLATTTTMNTIQTNQNTHKKIQKDLSATKKNHTESIYSSPSKVPTPPYRSGAIGRQRKSSSFDKSVGNVKSINLLLSDYNRFDQMKRVLCQNQNYSTFHSVMCVCVSIQYCTIYPIIP